MAQQTEADRRAAEERERQDKFRESLLANEAFAVGIMQAVSGGAVIAAIAQAETLTRWAGRPMFLLFITLACAALAAALLAALWRHHYRMWDVKAAAADSDDERRNRRVRAQSYLEAMRDAMNFATYALVVALVLLVGAMWFKEPRVVNEQVQAPATLHG